MYYELTDRFIVGSPPQNTWDFFSVADNLPLITPPWLNFTLLTPHRPIGLGSLLDYRIRWLGLPVRWRTLIIDWQPQSRFIDLQIRGPYVLWHHEHTFTPDADGTACTDRVLYKLPFWLVGRAAHSLLVRSQLLDIFRYRRKVIGERLGWVRSLQDDVEIRVSG